MFNKVKTAERVDALKNAHEKGLRTISGGIGLPPGEYRFTTQKGACTGTFETPTGWLLTVVLGTMEGRSFDENNLCVIPSNDWIGVKPEQNYAVTINEKGYVSKFILADVASDDDEA